MIATKITKNVKIALKVIGVILAIKGVNKVEGQCV